MKQIFLDQFLALDSWIKFIKNYNFFYKFNLNLKQHRIIHTTFHQLITTLFINV